MRDHNMVTVDEILKLPFFSNCRILSGLSGLDRAVRGWNVAERADFHLWIKGGEFIMSMLSFAPDPRAPEEAAGWLQSLVDSGASALGIKRSVYRGEPPRFLLELGDRNGFPIIEMDDGLSLPEAGEAIFSRVISGQAEVLKKALDAQTEMTQATVDGWIPGLIRQLAETLGNPVLFETSNLHLAGKGGENSEREKRALAARRDPDCVARIAEKLGDDGNYETVPMWNLRLVRHEFPVWGETCGQLTFPVEVAGNLYGYLSVIEAGREFGAGDLVTMRAASNTIALLALHDATYRLTEEVRHELFEAILSPEHEKAAEERAGLYGFDYITPVFCLIAKPALPENRGWIASEAVIKKLTGDMGAIDPEVLVIRHGCSIVTFCHALDDAAAKRQHTARLGYQERLDFLLSIFDNLKSVPELRFGAGRPGVGIAEIRAGFEEALASIHIAEWFGLPGKALLGQSPTVKYYSILYTLMRDERSARNFCQDVLGSLLTSTIRFKEKYLNTLEAYLFYAGSVAGTSKNTGIHRNTVKYRIAKMREILGTDFNDIQANMSIWLALQIRKYFAAGGDGG